MGFIYIKPGFIYIKNIEFWKIDSIFLIIIEEAEMKSNFILIKIIIGRLTVDKKNLSLLFMMMFMFLKQLS
jgi:hypothetical protein